MHDFRQKTEGLKIMASDGGDSKGWSLTSNAGRDDIFGKFLILPTTTFFPLVLSMVNRKKKKVSPKLTGEAN